jgi:hypothetical protein
MKNNNNNNTFLHLLPSDVIQVVFSFISIEELIILSFVSKSVKNFTSWTNTIQTSPYSEDIYHKDNAHRYRNSNGRNLNLRKSLPNINNMDPISAAIIIPRMPTTNSHPFMTETTLTHILSRFQNASTIKLHHLSHMGNAFLYIIHNATFHRTLVHVEFHNVQMIHNLTTLSLSLPGQVLRHFHHLEHLVLHGTIFSTYTSTLQYLICSPYLKILKLSGCRQLKDDDVWTMMTRLRSKLQILSLDNASKVIAPKIQSDTIHTLDLHQCIRLKLMTGIQCPNLLRIDLSYCSSIANGQIEALIRHSPHIQHLDLKACTGISNLILYSTSLKDIDLSLCTMLTNLTLDCTLLELCELGMCLKLKELFLKSDVIQGIDLSMLLLKQITIHTPRLVMLNLSGCYKLTTENVQLLHCCKLVDVDICETLLPSDIFTTNGTEHGIRAKVKQGGTGIDWMKLSGF